MMSSDPGLEIGPQIFRPYIRCLRPRDGRQDIYRTAHLRRVLYSSAELGAVFVLILLLPLLNANGAAQTVRSKDEVARIVSIEKLSVKEDGTVSGEVNNKSPHTLRDVEILVRNTWLWENEFRPGSNDPSAAHIYRLPEEIPPNATVPFTFSPSPPLAKVSGGRFVTSVSVAGFTEVIPQKR
jgi:hypothetical protein